MVFSSFWESSTSSYNSYSLLHSDSSEISTKVNVWPSSSFPSITTTWCSLLISFSKTPMLRDSSSSMKMSYLSSWKKICFNAKFTSWGLLDSMIKEESSMSAYRLCGDQLLNKCEWYSSSSESKETNIE